MNCKHTNTSLWSYCQQLALLEAILCMCAVAADKLHTGAVYAHSVATAVIILVAVHWLRQHCAITNTTSCFCNSCKALWPLVSRWSTAEHR
eukprot:3385-Heterococcus_DN1.PRE.5